MEAEDFPIYSSLQWLWQNNISILAVFNINHLEARKSLEDFKKSLPDIHFKETKANLGIKDIPPLSFNTQSRENVDRFHSEVVGLLGPAWGNNCKDLIKKLVV